MNGLDMVRTTSDKQISRNFQGQIAVFKTKIYSINQYIQLHFKHVIGENTSAMVAHITFILLSVKNTLQSGNSQWV